MPVLAVLQPDPRAFARLCSALCDRHHLIRCADWSALRETVESRSVDGCVVDLDRPSRAVSLRELQRLRRRRPPLALVVYADFADRELELFELGRLGLDGVLVAGRADDPPRIRRTVRGALADAVARRVTEPLEGRMSPLPLEVLRWSVAHALERPEVSDLASALGRSPATLARDLREAGGPPPRRLLLWGRLFQAARLLSRSDATVEEVALALGYSSRTALSRAFARETGHPPTEVVRRGGVGCVLDALLRGGRTACGARGRERSGG